MAKKTIQEIISGQPDVQVEQPEIVQVEQPEQPVRQKRKASQKQLDNLKKSRAARSEINSKKKDAYQKIQKLESYGVSFDDVIHHLEQPSSDSEDEALHQQQQVSHKIEW